ncbi:hypothetical protein V6Z11_A06G018900 [Gossypium hirsutum]
MHCKKNKRRDLLKWKKREQDQINIFVGFFFYFLFIWVWEMNCEFLICSSQGSVLSFWVLFLSV